MTASVIKFPTGPLEKNTVRHFNELFTRMDAAGLTPEQQSELMIQTCKEMGLVEIDGVWQLPQDTNEARWREIANSLADRYE